MQDIFDFMGQVFRCAQANQAADALERVESAEKFLGMFDLGLGSPNRGLQLSQGFPEGCQMLVRFREKVFKKLLLYIRTIAFQMDVPFELSAAAGWVPNRSRIVLS